MVYRPYTPSGRGILDPRKGYMGSYDSPCDSASLTDRHPDLNFGMDVKWKDIKVKFVCQGHRSKVRDTRSKNVSIAFLFAIY